MLGGGWPIGFLVCDVCLCFLSPTHMVSGVGCGAWLYQFMIFAFFFTSVISFLYNVFAGIEPTRTRSLIDASAFSSVYTFTSF